MESSYTPAHRFPVSVKGVAVQHGMVLLLQNERNEWELPGGKLELGDSVQVAYVDQARADLRRGAVHRPADPQDAGPLRL